MIASTRRAAKKEGLDKFYNGVYCKNGFNRFKRTSDGACLCSACETQRHTTTT